MRGGQELSLLDVCKGLSAKGHALTLAFVTPGDLEPEYRRICERMVRVRTYAVDRSRTAASLAEFVGSLLSVRGVRPDIVYANQYLDSLFAGAARRLFGAPFVCHLRLPPPDVMCAQFRVGMSQASHLIAISEQTRRDWIATGYPADRIAVVHNGIDTARYSRRGHTGAIRDSLGVPRDGLLVTYAGRLHPAKGVETLIEAVGLLPRERRAHLVLAGRPAVMPGANGHPRDYRAELKGVASARGVSAAITWIDHHADIPGLFSASDVVALPSIWSEPFGRVIIEAMACETPVVASRVGGIQEILTGEFAAWMFQAGSAADLAERLVTTVDQRAADPLVGSRARAHVVNAFSVDRMVDGVERALRS
jgi:glycosyltransferase involved in cell wall biosynthesis